MCYFILYCKDKCRDSDEKTLGKALLDIVGQKYGEGREAGQVTMDNVKLALVDLILAGMFNRYNQKNYFDI